MAAPIPGDIQRLSLSQHTSKYMNQHNIKHLYYSTAPVAVPTLTSMSDARNHHICWNRRRHEIKGTIQSTIEIQHEKNNRQKRISEGGLHAVSRASGPRCQKMGPDYGGIRGSALWEVLFCQGPELQYNLLKTQNHLKLKEGNQSLKVAEARTVNSSQQRNNWKECSWYPEQKWTNWRQFHSVRRSLEM